MTITVKNMKYRRYHCQKCVAVTTDKYGKTSLNIITVTCLHCTKRYTTHAYNAYIERKGIGLSLKLVRNRAKDTQTTHWNKNNSYF